MPSPPKPWEMNNNGAAITSPAAAASAVMESSDPPPVPTRSATAANGTSSAINRPGGAMGTSAYGTSTGYGTGTSYGSNYNRYGGYGGYGNYGNSMYGGGMYSSPYNRFGSYGSYNRMGYGGGMYGNNGIGLGPGEEIGLTQRMEAGTRATFEVIEQIVGAFGGFAQMLESTFMATQSSFMAMVGVAEQLGHLRSYLSQIFSIFALYRLVKRGFNKLTGRVEPGRPHEMNALEFNDFENRATAPKLSRKPIMIFFLMVVGLPYLMHKLIQLISSKQREQLQDPAEASQGMQVEAMSQVDPSKLEFAQATYNFQAESPMELNLKKGDIVAILSKIDPATNAIGSWWRGRLRDGSMGLFPANYVEIIQKASPTPPQPLPANSPVNNTTPVA